MEKHTYKCLRCFCIFVASEQVMIAPKNCSVCNYTQIEYMGKVGMDQRIKKEKLVCDCDERCTWAQGNKCNCVCGGANHQAGQYAYTRVIVDRGSAKLICNDLATIKKHRAICLEFERAKCLAENRAKKYPYNLLVTKPVSIGGFSYGKTQDREDWYFAREHWDKFKKALKYKVHSLRVKSLNECFTKVKK